MSKLASVVAVLGLLIVLGGLPAPQVSASVQPVDGVFDIGSVPLPVQELHEDGYQVMTGGHLDLEASVAWIAEPRELSMTLVSDELMDAGWMQTYVLDLVLLEDRAYADSDILALVQTNVSLFADRSGAADAYAMMTDYSGRQEAEAVDSAVEDSMTVRLPSGSGDTMRTVAVRERVVIEIVTLEAFGFVELAGHHADVAATVNRLQDLQQLDDVGLLSRGARLTDGERLADVQNLQQSGAHHLYRILDGQTQPAAGEVRAPSPGEIAPGAHALYYASEGIRLDGGTGFMSTWIGEFDSPDSAMAMMDELSSGAPSDSLLDPYFPIARNEQATPQGIEGLYRVTGVFNGQPYSGNLEIRRHQNHVVAIGFRTIGSTLPSVDITSRVMDEQLRCLEAVNACPPIPLSDLLTPPMATPVIPASSGDVIGSEEFGWTLQVNPELWTVTEQFSESGYDMAELQSDSSLVTLESVINQHGDPQQCIIDELNMLQELESSAVIDLGSDLDDENPAGSGPGHAWAIYTVEPLTDERADQEYVIRFDCYTLIDGGANLVMTHRAPRYEWMGERRKGDEIRNGLTLPSSEMNGLPVTIIDTSGKDGWRRAA